MHVADLMQKSVRTRRLAKHRRCRSVPSTVRYA